MCMDVNRDKRSVHQADDMITNRLVVTTPGVFLKRLPGVGSEPGSSQFHLFSHFHHFTAERHQEFTYLIKQIHILTHVAHNLLAYACNIRLNFKPKKIYLVYVLYVKHLPEGNWRLNRPQRSWQPPILKGKFRN
jgi:hypothetical protein